MLRSYQFHFVKNGTGTINQVILNSKDASQSKIDLKKSNFNFDSCHFAITIIDSVTLFYLWRPLIVILYIFRLLIRHIVKFCKAILTFPADIPCSPARSPVGFAVAMSGKTLEKAIELVKKATEEDEKKNYAEALKL